MEDGKTSLFPSMSESEIRLDTHCPLRMVEPGCCVSNCISHIVVTIWSIDRYLAALKAHTMTLSPASEQLSLA